MLILYIVLVIGMSVIASLLLPICKSFLSHHRMMSANYLGMPIPTGLGIYLWLLSLMYMLTWDMVLQLDMERFLSKMNGLIPDHGIMLRYTLALTIVCIIGWMDDSIGDRKQKGFRGHWRKFRHDGVITTGFIKVVGVSMAACWMVIPMADTVTASIIQSLLIILMTNMLNLLDLRPGRALKGYFILWMVLLFTTVAIPATVLTLPLIVGAVFLFPGDVKGKFMLGDTGANMIGFSIGFCYAVWAPMWVQVPLLVIGLMVHGYAERASITTFIEQNRMLRWIDCLGRTEI